MLEQEKELIRRAELLVLDTLDCDLDVALPYPTLVSALKKFDHVASWHAPTAWSLLRDWYAKHLIDCYSHLYTYEGSFTLIFFSTPCRLQTSLYMQFEPHYLAVAALHISSVILKNWDVSDSDIGWIEEFHVTYQQFSGITS